MSMTNRGKVINRRIQWLASIALVGTWVAIAQTTPADNALPDAPASRLTASALLQAPLTTPVTTNAAGNQSRQLTRAEAEQMAIQHNPRVSVSRLLALAQHQVVREVRAAELPTATAALTAVEAEDASRISAGSLTSSRLFTHAGAGGGFTQLITDFGRTSNMVASSKLQEKAQNANALATRDDVVLATDQAFYNALQAQELLKVAQQNVTTRQTLQSQVNQMATNQLKSSLDLSFANVNLSQGKLLLLDTQNNASSTMAALDEVLGLDHLDNYELVDETSTLQQPPLDLNQLVQQSLEQRPDLQATTF